METEIILKVLEIVGLLIAGGLARHAAPKILPRLKPKKTPENPNDSK